MGVRWLTGYVADNKRAVSSEVQLECRAGSSKTADKEILNGDKETAPASNVPHFVVDGWAFIFTVWIQMFGESIRSIDYEAYKDAIRLIVETWQSAGIEVVFVFDGPFLPSKLPTQVARRGAKAGMIPGFMHSSPQSRMSRSFQQASSISPCLRLPAIVDALRSLSVELVFAPTEADSLVAEIASRHSKGYAVSQDSDFFILCSRGQGCAGYVPLDSIEYLVNFPAQEQAPTSDPSSRFDDGFEQVRQKKRGGRKTASTYAAMNSSEPSTSRHCVALMPSSSEEQGTTRAVRFRAYRSHDLAGHLQLPPSLLPLFAALVGNDYTTSTQSNLLLRHIGNYQRIPSVAEMLRNEWFRVQNEAKSVGHARRGQSKLTMSNLQDFDDARSDAGSSATATPTRGTPGAVRSAANTIVPLDPVRSMVNAVVDKFLTQADSAAHIPRYVATGERELIVDSIIDSAATYSLLTSSDAPHLASASALFFGEAITLLATRREHVVACPEALVKYRQAYALGSFRSYLIETMAERVYLSHSLPEDPEAPSIHVGVAREIRLWAYAVIFEVWGMSWARPSWEEIAHNVYEDNDSNEDGTNGRSNVFAINRGYKDGEQPDDVISVDTESSESELGGSMEDEGEGLDDLPSQPGSVIDEHAADKPAPGVMEYVRLGTLYTGQLVRIRPVVELLRFGADVDLNDSAPRDDPAAEGGAKRIALPPSLASLLGQHEASQPTPSHEPSHSNGHRGPESDPAPAPLALSPLAVRLDVFLLAHHAHTPRIVALPKRHWFAASILRCLIIGEAKRLGARRTRMNWTRTEVSVAVRTMLASEQLKHDQRAAFSAEVLSVLPSTRAIHLASTLQLTSEASHLLVEALLLPGDEPQWTEPHLCFFGPLFHLGMAAIHTGINASAGLAQRSAADVAACRAIEDAVLEGLDADLGIDALDLKRERKAKKREARTTRAEQEDQSAQRSNGSAVAPVKAALKKTQNAFAALLDAE